MPTAAEFDDLAVTLDDRADALATMATTVADGVAGNGVRHAGLASRIDRVVRATEANVGTAVADLRLAADVCRERAERCRAYTAAMEHHRLVLGSYQALPPEQRLGVAPLGSLFFPTSSGGARPLTHVLGSGTFTDLLLASAPGTGWYAPVVPVKPGPWAEEG